MDLRPQEKRVEIAVEHVGGRLTCPECGASGPQADQAERRSWRHLDTMQFETRITAAVPRCGCAAWNGDDALVTLLLAHGPEPYPPDRYGSTPLHLAAKSGHTTILKRLIAAGAEVNRRDGDTVTPLHWAARNAQAAAVTRLLDLGTDPNDRNYANARQLNWARHYGNRATAEVLRNHPRGTPPVR